MQQQRRTLEERIARLEDIEAIKRLRAVYAHAADAKYDAAHRQKPQDEIDRYARIQADLYTEDAIWDGRPHWDRLVGREAFYEMARRSAWSMQTHYFTMPLIEVDGTAATAIWYLWQTGTRTRGDRAMILCATTIDDYRKINRNWLIAKTTFSLKYLTPIDVPWSQLRDVNFSWTE